MEYLYPAPGTTIEEDIVLFHALMISDGAPEYWYARCGDFGGGGAPAGGVLSFEHTAYADLNGTGAVIGYWNSMVSTTGTYPIDYSIDLTDGKNASRIHVDGWAVINCTADTEF